MWLSPWDNLVHGGDQLAHSLWAYATGGIAGTGIGQGDPQLVPAAHTDLILSALGEQWGFLGIAAVFALYAFLVYRALRIALRARSDYEFFLAAGMAAATALQVLLIAAGSLGVFPLSGVVTPFLSYGRTAMLANFILFGVLEAVSARQSQGTSNTAPFRFQRLRWRVLRDRRRHRRGESGLRQVLRSGPTIGAGRWSCRPMARAATSTIRACRRS